MPERKIALVLGATGGIGGEVARRLAAAGWRVRAMHRAPDRLPEPDARFEWVRGDAMSERDVVAAAAGANLIVHAVNPPGYRNWGRLVLPMLDSTIAAARASGARILLPGTVYNYGPDALPEIDEASPQNPVTRKGRIRAEMERRLRQASGEGVRVLVVRAGDFFGPGAANNWFSQGLVKPGRPVTAITNPGRPGTGHQWAYLPDVAETMVALLRREAELPAFATFHMNGHWDEDGTRMVAAIRRAAGDPALPVKRLPWRLMRLAAPGGAAVPRDRRDAPRVARADPHAQRPADRFPRRRAAHAARRGGAHDAPGARLPAGARRRACRRGPARRSRDGGQVMSLAASPAGRGAAQRLFAVSAVAVPLMVSLQVFLVGLAIFVDGGAWGLHRTNGSLIALPVTVAFVLAFGVAELARFRPAVGRVVALYVLQIVWLELGRMTGLGIVQALHALNAVMLMGAAVTLAERAGRR